MEHFVTYIIYTQEEEEDDYDYPLGEDRAFPEDIDYDEATYEDATSVEESEDMPGNAESRDGNPDQKNFLSKLCRFLLRPGAKFSKIIMNIVLRTRSFLL